MRRAAGVARGGEFIDKEKGWKAYEQKKNGEMGLQKGPKDLTSGTLPL